MKTVPALGTSVSRLPFSITARVAQMLSLFIPGTSSPASQRNARPTALQIPRGQVHRLEQRDGVRELQVIDGTVWLTATPADGDVLLRSGERFALPATGPIVFEALKDASVLFVRHVAARG